VGVSRSSRDVSIDWRTESLTDDNTATPRMRGDYAVSTLFDGNFDAVNDPGSFVRNTISTAIPG
jgi:hypothetical protein